MVHKVSYEYDQDPRYGWVKIVIGSKSWADIVIEDTDGATYGFKYSNGIVVPTCICSAYTESECACPNYPWSHKEHEDY